MGRKLTSKEKPAGDPAAFAQAAKCLKTLVHPVRLRMVQLLLHGRHTVGELAAECEVPDNVTSVHLRLMHRRGFFASERDGRRVCYQVAEPQLQDLVKGIKSRFVKP